MMRYLTAAFLMGFLLVLGSSDPLRATPNADLIIYDDALAAGWEDWSWDSTVNFASGAPVYEGMKAAAVTFDAPWAGFSLRTSPPLAANGYTHLEFWIYGNGRSQSLYTQPTDAGPPSPAYNFTPAANAWTQVSVPLSAFGSPSAIARINLQDDSGAAQPPFYLDAMRLTADGGTILPFADFLADRVLGQPDFDSGSSGTAVGQFDWPSGVAAGPDGKLFVVDFRNNRVVRYPAAVDFSQPPDLVLDTSNGVTPLNGPESVAVDGSGYVYVAETLAHRVLIYPPDNTVATVAIGQYGLGCPAGTLTFNFPRGLALDGNGRLFVADQFHHRVLIFTPPFSSGMNPSGVIGQSSLTACEPNGGGANPTNQSGLWGPRGVALDGADNLYVADSENNRVLQFAAPLSDGQAAAFVFGQPNFSNSGQGSTLAQMHFPIDLALDAAGNLYASDMFNNRVLGFMPPFSSGQAADFLFGDPRVTGSNCYDDFPTLPVGQTLFYCPQGLAFDDQGSLYLADALHHRVLAFDRPGLNEAVYLPLITR